MTEARKSDLRRVFFLSLAACFGSNCINCIYGIIDVAVVGQYYGPDGTAAMGIVQPFFNVFYSLGLMLGIGGSVLYSVAKGKGDKRANEYFTITSIMVLAVSILLYLVLWIFEDPLLRLMGADDSLIVLCKEYLFPIKIGAPVVMLAQCLGAILRNDNDAGLATLAIIVAGVVNITLDIVLVSVVHMGMVGAGIATTLGNTTSCLIMLTHFLKKSNSYRFMKPSRPMFKVWRVIVTGFPAFLSDMSVGVTNIFMNRAIGKYLGNAALSVYAVIIKLMTFVLCLGYTVGHASQPMCSLYHGEGKKKEIRDTVILSLIMCGVFGLLAWGLVSLLPTQIIYMFMTPTEEVLSIAPHIMRVFSIAFIFMPLNVFASYFFESVERNKTAIIITLLRGFITSVALILVIPLISVDGIFVAVPINELAYAIINGVIIYLLMRKMMSELPPKSTSEDELKAS